MVTYERRRCHSPLQPCRVHVQSGHPAVLGSALSNSSTPGEAQRISVMDNDRRFYSRIKAPRYDPPISMATVSLCSTSQLCDDPEHRALIHYGMENLETLFCIAPYFSCCVATTTIRASAPADLRPWNALQACSVAHLVASCRV